MEKWVDSTCGNKPENPPMPIVDEEVLRSFDTFQHGTGAFKRNPHIIGGIRQQRMLSFHEIGGTFGIGGKTLAVRGPPASRWARRVTDLRDQVSGDVQRVPNEKKGNVLGQQPP